MLDREGELKASIGRQFYKLGRLYQSGGRDFDAGKAYDSAFEIGDECLRNQMLDEAWKTDFFFQPSRRFWMRKTLEIWGDRFEHHADPGRAAYHSVAKHNLGRIASLDEHYLCIIPTHPNSGRFHRLNFTGNVFCTYSFIPGQSKEQKDEYFKDLEEKVKYDPRALIVRFKKFYDQLTQNCE